MFVPTANLFVRARETLEFLLVSEVEAPLVEELIKRLFEVISAADVHMANALAPVINMLLKIRLKYLSTIVNMFMLVTLEDEMKVTFGQLTEQGLRWETMSPSCVTFNA
jgi:hypothetical protein